MAEPEWKRLKIDPNPVMESQDYFEYFIGSCDHIMIKILQELDLKTLLNCQSVRKSWLKFTNEEMAVWYPHLQKLKTFNIKNYYNLPANVIQSELPFVQAFPQWDTIIDKLQNRAIEITGITFKNVLKTLRQYLQIDWMEVLHKIEEERISKMQQGQGVYVDFWNQPYCPLVHAIKREDRDFVRTIIQSRVEFDEPILKELIRRKDEELLKSHLVSLETVTTETKIAIMTLACDFGNLEIVQFCLNHWREDNLVNCQAKMSMRTPLIRACDQGNLDLVRLLLAQNNLNFGLTDERRRSALHSASEQSVNILELLLNNPLNLLGLNTVQIQARTALHLAIIRQKYDNAQCLLRCQGIDVNIRDIYGRTPLFYLIQKWNNTTEEMETLELFCNHELDIDEQDNRGKTLLHHACVKTVDLVRKLLQLFPDINVLIRDENGETPSEFARQLGHYQIMEEIQIFGGDMEFQYDGDDEAIFQ